MCFSTHGKANEEWMEGGYEDIWMNEEDNNAFGPLTNINCFHVDVQEII
jgi:hypothetical protein